MTTIGGIILRIGFIGAGKVGFTLGKYFAVHNIRISGYLSRKAESAEAAAEFTGSRWFKELSELVALCDVIFITVPDAAIREVFIELTKYDITGKQLCHCSGAMSARDAFEGIEKYGAEGYSLHPLFPVSSKYDSYLTIGKAWFCIEGNGTHLPDWKAFFEKLGNPVRILSHKDKTAYHAACTVASNLVCALVYESIETLEKCGFSECEALTALEPLITANINSILKNGVVDALTGPVERCDCGTVQKHLSCFEEGKERELYRAASLKLVDIAKKKHPDADFSVFDGILY
ncbi:MAG: DUF2520 domain-containing protein [Clostridia bacterium]|nr:DUF2520 domain-containing protein [Clostridia bacterium]